MSVINGMLGLMIYGVAKALFMILDFIIQLIETLVLFVRSITKGCLALISMGGCLFILLFAGPLGFRLLTDPYALLTLVFVLSFPKFGTRLASFLKYLKYVSTEFLFNLSNHLMDSKKYKFKSFSEYKMDYKRAEEQRIRKEQLRYQEQQRQWEEQFTKQWHQQSSQSWQGCYGGQGSYSNGFVNSTAEFKKKYEKSCDILGVTYNSDKSLIKLAFRKKAKVYHPDLSKDPDTVKKFQEINDANEFLNDDNIEKYKSL